MITHPTLKANHVPNEHVSEIKESFFKISDKDSFDNFMSTFEQNIKCIFVNSRYQIKPKMIFEMLKNNKICFESLSENKEYIFDQMMLFMFESSKSGKCDLIQMCTLLGFSEEKLNSMKMILDFSPDDIYQARIDRIQKEHDELYTYEKEENKSSIENKDDSDYIPL